MSDLDLQAIQERADELMANTHISWPGIAKRLRQLLVEQEAALLADRAERQQELAEAWGAVNNEAARGDNLEERAEAAEADREALREALQEIVRTSTALPHSSRIDRDNMRELARQALARLSSANQETP